MSRIEVRDARRDIGDGHSVTAIVAGAAGTSMWLDVTACGPHS